MKKDEPDQNDTTQILTPKETEQTNTDENDIELQNVKHRTPSGQSPSSYIRISSKDDIGLSLTKQVTDKYVETTEVIRRSYSLGSCPKQTNADQDGLEDDEGFLIGKCGVFQVLRSRAQSRVRITEVVPCNSELVTAESDVAETWKYPVRIFTDKKYGKTKKNDKKMTKRIRSYYKEQDELINAFEDIQLDLDDDEARAMQESAEQQRAELLAKISFVCNFMLLIVKAVAAALSSSISIISSLVDSAVDLLSGVIIWWTSRAIKNKNIYHYPGGRSRLEPIAIVILSVIMSLASFQLVIESIQKIVEFTSDEGTVPTVQLAVILIAASTVVVKFILFMLCYRMGKKSSSVQALALDHRNDVLSNIVAIVCGYLGSKEFVATAGKFEVVYIDPIGAILISCYILVNWWKTGYEQIKLLTGHTADANFLSKITWLCLNHHREIIMIDTVRAFHFGNQFLVEVDIVLPEEMSLKEAHNIGEALQQKLEKFQQVERAFVHLDYETSHHPNEEHKAI